MPRPNRLPYRRRLPVVGGMIVALAAVGAAGWVGGRLGVVLMVGLLVALAALGVLLRLVLRTQPRPLPARLGRGMVAAVLALLLGWGALEGGLTIFRFTGDHAALPGPERYVCIIVADGASLLHARELLQRSLRDPNAYASDVSAIFPNVSRTFLTHGAFTANGIAVWPSSSIPAHTGIMTGCYPRRTGVMGQRQFSPVHRQYVSYIGLGILRHRRELDPRVKTLYEYFPQARSLDVLQVVNRGCSLYVPEQPHDAQVTLRARQVMQFCAAASRVTGRNEVPRILVVTLPGIDHQTHNSLLSDDKALRAYREVDQHVGETFDLYRRLGIIDKTLFVLAADHGMGEVTNHVTLDNLMHDMRFTTYQAFRWSAVPAWGSFEANIFVGTRRKFDRSYNCVPLWGGNSDALLYIKGQQRGAGGRVVKESWGMRATEGMLTRYHIGGTDINVIQRLLDYSPGIGLIFTNPAPGVFHVFGHSGVGEIRERQHAGQTEFRYRVLRGEDPLGYSRNPQLAPLIAGQAWLADADWLRLTYLEHYPDALRRITGSMEHPNAGDMHIVATDGWDFTPHYVARNVLVGSHGSLNRQQSLVPIMFCGPGVAHRELPYARTVDILPTVLAYLGVTPGPMDGRALNVFGE